MISGSLAERLRVLRAQRGMTLVEAAEQAGVGRDTLSDLERGRRRPVMPTLSKIAEGYGVPVEDLLEEPVPLAQASDTGRLEEGPSSDMDPELQAIAEQAERDAREFEAAGGRVIRLSKGHDYTDLLERARAGDVESLQEESATIEDRYQKAVRLYGVDNGFTLRGADAYAATLAALALAKGGRLEDIQAAILRALSAQAKEFVGA